MNLVNCFPNIYTSSTIVQFQFRHCSGEASIICKSTKESRQSIGVCFVCRCVYSHGMYFVQKNKFKLKIIRSVLETSKETLWVFYEFIIFLVDRFENIVIYIHQNKLISINLLCCVLQVYLFMERHLDEGLVRKVIVMGNVLLSGMFFINKWIQAMIY